MTIKIWKIVLETLQVFGIFGGAAWVYWRFLGERVHAPQVEFSVEAVLHGPSVNQYAAEYVLTFENKGKTRVQTDKIELRVRGIKRGEHLNYWEGKPERLLFPQELVKNRAVIPETYGYTFFEPGIKQEYRYISLVDTDYQFIVVRGQFFYAKGNTHSAERVVTVKANETTC